MKSYNFTDCIPIGTYSKQELIKLEHTYRLLLRKSGFLDIEQWDNSPKRKRKQVKFIRNSIRYRGKTSLVYFTEAREKEEFFRIIGLYAYHANIADKRYKKVLQDYSLTGNLSLSVRNTGNCIRGDYVWRCIKRDFPAMLKFVLEDKIDD